MFQFCSTYVLSIQSKQSRPWFLLKFCNRRKISHPLHNRNAPKTSLFWHIWDSACFSKKMCQMGVVRKHYIDFVSSLKFWTNLKDFWKKASMTRNIEDPLHGEISNASVLWTFFVAATYTYTIIDCYIGFIFFEI